MPSPSSIGGAAGVDDLAAARESVNNRNGLGDVNGFLLDSRIGFGGRNPKLGMGNARN